MNYRVISYILGWVLGLEALFLTVSAAVYTASAPRSRFCTPR